MNAPTAQGTFAALHGASFASQRHVCGISGCASAFTSEVGRDAHQRDKHGIGGHVEGPALQAAQYLAGLPAACRAQLLREWDGPSFTNEMTPERRAHLEREWDNNSTDGGC